MSIFNILFKYIYKLKQIKNVVASDSSVMYIGGIMPNVAKKIGKFHFGEKRYINFMKDVKNHKFIFVANFPATDYEIKMDEYFKSFWSFDIMYQKI